MVRTSSDPRAVRSRSAILAAATRLLLAGGMERVTHQAVATEAGVGRATVYRHWPQRLDLILETLDLSTDPVFEFGEGELRENVISELTRRLDWFNQPIAGPVIGALISGAEHDDAIARIRDELFGPSVDQLKAAMAAAARSGQLPPDFPVRTVATMILGAVLFERHMLGNQVSVEFVRAVVHSAFDVAR